MDGWMSSMNAWVRTVFYYYTSSTPHHLPVVGSHQNYYGALYVVCSGNISMIVVVVVG